MGYLSNRSTAELYALLNNGDGTILSEDARRELAARGDLPAWAAAPSNVDANLEAAATPIAPDPSLGGGKPQGRVPADPEDYRFDTRTGVVGPRTDDGRQPRMAPTFSSAEEAAEYYVRPRHPETGELMPSRADEAMAARGFVATETPGGGSAYQIGYAAGKPAPDGVTDQMNYYTNHRLPNGKLAYEVESKDGPTGTFDALVPTPALRQYQYDRAQEASADRVAARTGLKAEDLMDPAVRGRALRKNYEQEQQARRDRVASMAMLAGGSQNINSGNRWMFNALLELPAEERAAALRDMLPMNPVRAQVEAQNMANAGDVIKRFYTSGAAGMLTDPEAAKEARDAVRRKNNPDAAGAGDLSSGDWTTPEARGKLETLAELHDTGGWNTMSWEDEAKLAQTLQKPPYNMEMSEAEAAAHWAAEQRRWFFLQGNARPSSPSAPSTFPGSTPAPPPSNPGAAPRPYG